MPQSTDAGDRTVFIFAFRDKDSQVGFAASLGIRTADARDFESFLPPPEDIDGALVLDTLNMVIMQSNPAEAAAWAIRPAIADTLIAYRESRYYPIVTTAARRHQPAVGGDWGISATGVGASNFTGRGVRVAVLDIALDDLHPDFKARPDTHWHSLNGKPANRSPWLHGTAVCGIVAGPVNPSSGPRYGVASDCELFFGRVGHDKFGYHDATVLAGLQWAADNGCRVVNLSLGMEVRKGTASDPVFDTALAKAVAANLLVVAAGGNHSQRASGHTAPVQEPANSADALAVGAVDAASVIAEFSPAGLNGSGGEVNLVAPGVTVRSACANGAVIGTDYTNFSFTSYATPFVTGIAALWLEKDPTLSVAQLWQRLESTAKPLGSNIDFGAGLVQAP